MTVETSALSDVALIGLDWGSTNLRAYAFAATGEVIDTRTSESGALTLVGPAAFDAALRTVVQPWLAVVDKVRDRAEIPMITCGMVGSKSGWREAPYCECGAGAKALAEHAIHVETTLGNKLAIIPGIRSTEPDVMRGEETQLIGCGLTEGIVVLPGTHSKWVELRDGVVHSFATFMTGEMNALIRGQSSMVALLKDSPNAADLPAFDLGVNYARAGAASWLHDLFVLRASVVSGQRSAAEISTVFAGWLLGCEFAAALSMYPNARKISLIASPNLVPWYELAATRFALSCDVLDAGTATPRGLWHIARALIDDN